MTLLEGFIRNNIFVDEHDEPWCGCDTVYDSYPKRFATVTLQLADTQQLCQIADSIRTQRGFLPMMPIEGSKQEYDPDCWYDFYVGLNDYAMTKVDSCIEFVVCNSDQEDNEETYQIDLSGEEQMVLYERLNKQCKLCYGQNCEELLAAARREMEETYESEV